MQVTVWYLVTRYNQRYSLTLKSTLGCLTDDFATLKDAHSTLAVDLSTDQLL